MPEYWRKITDLYLKLSREDSTKSPKALWEEAYRLLREEE